MVGVSTQRNIQCLCIPSSFYVNAVDRSGWINSQKKISLPVSSRAVTNASKRKSDERVLKHKQNENSMSASFSSQNFILFEQKNQF